MEQLLGAHTSIAGGVSTSVERAEKVNFTAMQIFSKNNNRWLAKPLSDNEIKLFRERLTQSNIKFTAVHDSYLINLCAKNKELLKKSRNAFVDEINRCEQLGIEYLNFHPGAHKGIGEEDGLKLIAESINITHEKTTGYKVQSMLETTAGQGTNLGYTFEQLRKIIDMVDVKERMCVCIDTAHIFSAGYDLRSSKEYEKTMKEFDDIIGMNLLKCFHINDSKKELGSKVDRHEHIGKGFIGKEGFRNIMNDKKIAHVPKILETPKGKDMKEDIMNLKLLKSLMKK